jgi:hypothetical protein
MNVINWTLKWEKEMQTKNKPGQDESKSWENQEREEWINKIQWNSVITNLMGPGKFVRYNLGSVRYNRENG